MIETWNRPDYAKVLKEREEAMERGRQRRQQEREALEWQRQQKAEQERQDLWSWYAGYDVAESFAARDRARDAVAAEELQKDIRTQVLITEIDREVEQSPEKRNICVTSPCSSPSPKTPVACQDKSSTGVCPYDVYTPPWSVRCALSIPHSEITASMISRRRPSNAMALPNRCSL